MTTLIVSYKQVSDGSEWQILTSAAWLSTYSSNRLITMVG